MTNRKSKAFYVRGMATISTLIVFAGLSTDAAGRMMGDAHLNVDFTKAEDAKSKVTWNRQDLIACTKDGIGWNGRANEFCDVQFQTTEPVAIGWSWRTVYAARVRAQIFPAGEFQFGNGTATYPAGQFFARYSPDAKHWSSWCALQMDQPKDRQNPRQTYSGELRVPEAERTGYLRLLSEYSTLDVPWKSDEEAAVKWALQKDPKLFESATPFIGYVQFLFETSLQGGTRIREFQFDLDFGAGGVSSIPRDPDARKDRDGPWRYKAVEH